LQKKKNDKQKLTNGTSKKTAQQDSKYLDLRNHMCGGLVFLNKHYLVVLVQQKKQAKKASSNTPRRKTASESNVITRPQNS